MQFQNKISHIIATRSMIQNKLVDNLSHLQSQIVSKQIRAGHSVIRRSLLNK